MVFVAADAADLDDLDDLADVADLADVVGVGDVGDEKWVAQLTARHHGAFLNHHSCFWRPVSDDVQIVGYAYDC